jgi:hypothetical protein
VCKPWLDLDKLASIIIVKAFTKVTIQNACQNGANKCAPKPKAFLKILKAKFFLNVDPSNFFLFLFKSQRQKWFNYKDSYTCKINVQHLATWAVSELAQ